MHSLFPAWAFLPILIYIGIIVFTIWLAYRFVRAQESMAESLKRIEEKLSKDSEL